MSDYIKRLIAEGEHQMLDFKFEISDFKKIARTLVAYANTDGGRILIGVKDNGSIAGVRSDEEFYMAEGAARLYCKPEVPLKIRKWTVEGKVVLEVIIEPGKEKPYRCKDEEGKWVAYIRQNDENFRAGRVTLKVWKRQRAGRGTVVRFREAERMLLKHLEAEGSTTSLAFRQLAGIDRDKAEDILVGFVMLDLLEFRYTDREIVYRLKPGYEKVLEGMEDETINKV